MLRLYFFTVETIKQSSTCCTHEKSSVASTNASNIS